MSSGVGGGYAPGRTLASLSPEASMEASPRTGCGRAIGLVEAEGSPSRIILGIITGGRSPKVAATVVSPVLEAGIPTSTTGETKDDKGRLASGRTAATLDDTEGRHRLRSHEQAWLRSHFLPKGKSSAGSPEGAQARDA